MITTLFFDQTYIVLQHDEQHFSQFRQVLQCKAFELPFFENFSRLNVFDEPYHIKF